MIARARARARARAGTLAAFVLVLAPAFAGACAPAPVTPTSLPRAGTTTRPSPSADLEPTLEPRRWHQIGAEAFLAEEPITAVGVEHTTLGEVILGSIGGSAAGWFRDTDGVWSRIPLEASTEDSRLVAAAASEHELVVGVFAEGGTSDAIWRRSAEGWTVVRADGAFPEGSVVRAMTWTGTEFVAVGQRSPNEDGTTSIEEQVAAVWTSTDGLAWQRAELRTAARGSWLSRVEAGPGGVVAAGQIAGGTSDAFVLRYVGGLWEHIKPPGVPTEGDEFVTALASNAAGWHLGIGVRPVDCSQVCPEQGRVGLTSADAVEWELASVRDGAPVPFGGEGAELYGAVTADGLTLVVRQSVDGESWVDATAVLDPPGETMVRAVTRVEGGFLAVGESADGALLTWEWRDRPD